MSSAGIVLKDASIVYQIQHALGLLQAFEDENMIDALDPFSVDRVTDSVISILQSAHPQMPLLLEKMANLARREFDLFKTACLEQDQRRTLESDEMPIAERCHVVILSLLGPICEALTEKADIQHFPQFQIRLIKSFSEFLSSVLLIWHGFLLCAELYQALFLLLFSALRANPSAINCARHAFPLHSLAQILIEACRASHEDPDNLIRNILRLSLILYPDSATGLFMNDWWLQPNNVERLYHSVGDLYRDDLNELVAEVRRSFILTPAPPDAPADIPPSSPPSTSQNDQIGINSSQESSIPSSQNEPGPVTDDESDFEQETDDDDDEEGEVYVIDAIVDYKVNGYGKREYLVHWKGYPADSTEWKSESSLQKTAKELLQTYTRAQRVGRRHQA